MYAFCPLILALAAPLAVETPSVVDAPVPPPVPAEMESLESSLRRVGNLLVYQNLELPGRYTGEEATVQPSAAKDVLVRMYASKDEDTRLRAVEGWAASGDADVTELLVQALLDPAAEVQAAAAHALKSLDAEIVLKGLLPLLESQDRAFMAQAPRILPALGDQLGGAFLDRLQAASATPVERMASAYALGVMRYTPAAATLAKGIQSTDVSFSRTCTMALLELDPASRQKEWLALLGHPDPEIALVAVDAARRFGGNEALAYLGRLAAGRTREEGVLQLRAMQAVGEWPVGASVPMLINIMAENPRLASAVNKLIAAKTQQDFGPNARIWSDWWVQKTGQPSPLPPPPAKNAPESSAPQTRALSGIINP